MYIYGAGGHAKVIIDILKAQGTSIDALVDDNPAITDLCGYPVIHGRTDLSPAIVAVGNCATRRRIVQRLSTVSEGGCEFVKAIHPSAIISPSATVGEGSVVMQGAIVQADSRIGRHCIINTKASVDHECVIADYVHIAPGCTVSGDVHIGEGTWLGVGSTVIQGIRIGRDCYIGAGAVVVSDIPDGSLAYGVPCRVIKKL